jgi:hypothetical protein
MNKKKTFADLYQEQKDKDELRKQAFFYFNDKYFKNPFENYFIIEQEERFLAKRLKFFIPGRVYTFQYDPIYADQLDCYDKRPMVYIMGHINAITTGRDIVRGINLNFLPEWGKVNFLDLVVRLFEKQYEQADKAADRGQLDPLKELGKVLNDQKFFTENFDQVAKIGVSYATRNYDLGRITKPVLIEMEDFAMIPYFMPREFVGLPPARIYSDYMKKKNEIIQKSIVGSKNTNRVNRMKKRYKNPGS